MSNFITVEYKKLFSSNILTGLPTGTTLLIVSAREEHINSLKMLF